MYHRRDAEYGGDSEYGNRERERETERERQRRERETERDRETRSTQNGLSLTHTYTLTHVLGLNIGLSLGLTIGLSFDLDGSDEQIGGKLQLGRPCHLILERRDLESAPCKRFREDCAATRCGSAWNEPNNT